MRILCLEPDGQVIPFIRISMINAFRSLGHEVLSLSYPLDKAGMNVIKSIASNGPTALFSLDLPIDPNLRNIINEIHKSFRIPLVIWFVDDPDGYDFPNGLDTDWTIVFCWDREITRQISVQGSWKGIEPTHLPLATDPELFGPAGNDSTILFPGGVFVGSVAHTNRVFDEAMLNCAGFEESLMTLWEAWKKDLSQVSQDLVWGYLQGTTRISVGALQKDPLARLWAHSTLYALGRIKRKDIVSRVIGEGGGVFGNREWDQTMGDFYRGEVTYGEGLRRVYQTSTFVLDTRQPQSRTGLTQRIFDASACGIPVLAEHSPELEECFSPQKEIFSFRTIDEALDNKKNILCDPKSSFHGMRAKNRVLAQHTYRHRAARIIDAIQPFFAVSRA